MSPPPKGTYVPRKSTDIRSPCPVINTLANHGYIARSGRNVHANELQAALGEIGVGSLLASLLANPPFLELHTGTQAPPPPPTWTSMMSNPLTKLLGKFALRDPGQVDAEGIACLNLDQLDRPNVVEHDVSLTRFDYAQGDNHTPQPELIKDLLAASSNGSTFTLADLVNFRKARFERQKRDNPKLHFEDAQNQVACGEIALILGVFGDGSEVPLSYVKAVFEDERLPTNEGWKKRWWWSVGLIELATLSKKVKAMLGDIGGEKMPVVSAVL